MTQIRRECPNRTLMTSPSPDLPRPNRRGFSGDATILHTITVRPRKCRLGGEQRRALQLLGSTPCRRTEAHTHANRFTPPTPAHLTPPALSTPPHPPPTPRAL